MKTNGPTGSAGVKLTSLNAPDPRSEQRLATVVNGRRHPRDVRIISRDFH